MVNVNFGHLDFYLVQKHYVTQLSAVDIIYTTEKTHFGVKRGSRLNIILRYFHDKTALTQTGINCFAYINAISDIVSLQFLNMFSIKHLVCRRNRNITAY